MRSDYSAWEKMLLMGYEQIRAKEDFDQKVQLAGLKK